MKEQGGRQIVVNQNASILFDPRIQMPVLVDEESNIVPRLGLDRYVVELKLIKD